MTGVEGAPAEEHPGRALLALLWRERLTLTLVAAAVTSATTLATLVAAPLFAAEASLVVRIGREYVYRPETGPDTLRMPSLDEMVHSEAEILASRDLAEVVVRQMGVDRLYPDLGTAESEPELALERGIALFRTATSIHPVPDSSVIKIAFEHSDPRTAAEAVNLLVARFVDKHVEVLGEEDSRHLEAELARRARALEDAEQALAEFKHENGIVDLAQQQNLLLSRRATLEHALDECERALVSATPAGAPVQGVDPVQCADPARGTDPAQETNQDEPCPLPELPAGLSLDMKGELLHQRFALEREGRARTSAGPSWLVEQASLRALDLELEERRLLRDYEESNRRVQSVRAERERVRAFLDGAELGNPGSGTAVDAEQAMRAQALDDEIARLDDTLLLLNRVALARQGAAERERVRGLERERGDLRQRLAEADGELASLAQHALSLQRLERDQRIAESALAAESGRVEAAHLAAELDREKLISVRVIEQAVPPVTPLGLSRTLRIALGAVLGLVLGASTVLVRDLVCTRA